MCSRKNLNLFKGGGLGDVARTRESLVRVLVPLPLTVVSLRLTS